MNKKQVIRRIKELDWGKYPRRTSSKRNRVVICDNRVEFVVFDKTDEDGWLPEFTTYDVNELWGRLSEMSMKYRISSIWNIWATGKRYDNGSFVDSIKGVESVAPKTIINIKESNDFSTNIDADVLDAFVKLSSTIGKI